MAVLAGLHPAAKAAPSLLPRLGDYLDLDYLDVLQKSGSPWQAGAADTRAKLPQVISVQADEAGRRIALDYGFRDGRLLLVLRRNGQMFRQMAWSSEAGLALRLAPGGDLCLARLGVPAEHCYRFVGDARFFVSKATLVGRWRDRQGQLYWFSADGHGHFPGFDFDYALALDRLGWGFDGFEVEGAGGFWRIGVRVAF